MSKVTFTQILLGLAILLMGTEVLVHCTRKEKPIERALSLSQLKADTIEFDINNVITVEPEKDSDCGYRIEYAVNDSITINLYTSLMEGDYLMVYLDCLSLYQEYQSEEDIDDLCSYLLNNSHVTYQDNPWFQGFIWTYDACPVYRFQ